MSSRTKSANASRSAAAAADADVHDDTAAERSAKYCVNETDQRGFVQVGIEATRRELNRLWAHFEKNPEDLKKTKWYRDQSEKVKEEYHNDLKRMGMNKATIDSLKLTNHDQAYYIDIVVVFVILIVAGIILWLTK